MTHKQAAMTQAKHRSLLLQVIKSKVETIASCERADSGKTENSSSFSCVNKFFSHCINKAKLFSLRLAARDAGTGLEIISISSSWHEKMFLLAHLSSSSFVFFSISFQVELDPR
jgi:hypothetical protein